MLSDPSDVVMVGSVAAQHFSCAARSRAARQAKRGMAEVGFEFAMPYTSLWHISNVYCIDTGV